MDCGLAARDSSWHSINQSEGRCCKHLKFTSVICDAAVVIIVANLESRIEATKIDETHHVRKTTPKSEDLGIAQRCSDAALAPSLLVFRYAEPPARF